MRGVTRDQQFLVFLTSNLTGVMNAGDPSAKTPRYAVRYLTWGFDSSAAGLMEIVSGKTARIITGVKYEDMGPFLDKEVTQVAAEIRKAVESKDN
jgi:hypothetical protein